MRVNLDEYFMDIAVAVAGRATCPRAQVGAVLVSGRNILSTGYNGAPHGCSHCEDVGCSVDLKGECKRSVHAEVNAVIHARGDVTGSTMYCTLRPCYMCTQVLINAGISRVVWAKERHLMTEEHEQMISESGIIFEQLKGENHGA